MNVDEGHQFSSKSLIQAELVMVQDKLQKGVDLAFQFHHFETFGDRLSVHRFHHSPIYVLRLFFSAN